MDTKLVESYFVDKRLGSEYYTVPIDQFKQSENKDSSEIIVRHKKPPKAELQRIDVGGLLTPELENYLDSLPHRQDPTEQKTTKRAKNSVHVSPVRCVDCDVPVGPQK
jgi:hypothetical protein